MLYYASKGSSWEQNMLAFCKLEMHLWTNDADFSMPNGNLFDIYEMFP